jgi:hypothetical protein
VTSAGVTIRNPDGGASGGTGNSAHRITSDRPDQPDHQ